MTPAKPLETLPSPETIKSGAYLGIDPGVAKASPGAAALITTTDGVERVHVFDWPGDIKAAGAEVRTWADQHDIVFALLEDPPPYMPGDKRGQMGAYILGRNVGHWEALLVALGIRYRMVPPKEWQRAMLPPPGGKSGITTKDRSLYVAREMAGGNPDFLRHKKHHGRADALCLAGMAKRETYFWERVK